MCVQDCVDLRNVSILNRYLSAAWRPAPLQASFQSAGHSVPVGCAAKFVHRECTNPADAVQASNRKPNSALVFVGRFILFQPGDGGTGHGCPNPDRPLPTCVSRPDTSRSRFARRSCRTRPRPRTGSPSWRSKWPGSSLGRSRSMAVCWGWLSRERRAREMKKRKRRIPLALGVYPTWKQDAKESRGLRERCPAYVPSWFDNSRTLRSQ